MNNLWLRIKVWSKITVVTLVVLYVVVFTAKNSKEPAHFWYWYNHTLETTLLILVLCAFLAGVIASLLFRTMIRTVRQVQDLQDRSRAQRIDRQLSDIQTKAAKLQIKPPATDTVAAQQKTGDKLP
jgi:uncharacterized integral membrane protein